MPTSTSPGETPATPPSRAYRTTLRPTTIGVIVLAIVAVEPAAAQASGTAFCGTALADTIRNVFTIVQFGGPLIGGTIALGSTVALPVVRRSDLKLELKETRNQALVWGVLVAPLATLILAFLLNNVVAGGASCSF